MHYSTNPNRATNVPVTILHADGKATVKVNQCKPAPLDRAFIPLGVFRFKRGNAGYVEIGNRDVDGEGEKGRKGEGEKGRATLSPPLPFSPSLFLPLFLQRLASAADLFGRDLTRTCVTAGAEAAMLEC